MSVGRRIAVTVAALTAVLVWATPAWAHVSLTPAEAPPGFTYLKFRIGHGCEGEATETLRVQIPEGVASVKPEMLPDWEAETDVGALDEPVEVHGEEVTEGVREVRWSGTQLPDDLTKEFGMSVYLAGEPGTTVEFPAIQECVDGSELAWIQTPGEGETRDDLEEPAPALTITGDASNDGDDETSGDTQEAGVLAGLSPTAAALAALVVGLAALVMGVVAFLRAGRRA